jgi:hypothetical protein
VSLDRSGGLHPGRKRKQDQRHHLSSTGRRNAVWAVTLKVGSDNSVHPDVAMGLCGCRRGGSPVGRAGTAIAARRSDTPRARPSDRCCGGGMLQTAVRRRRSGTR